MEKQNKQAVFNGSRHQTIWEIRWRCPAIDENKKDKSKAVANFVHLTLTLCCHSGNLIRLLLTMVWMMYHLFCIAISCAYGNTSETSMDLQSLAFHNYYLMSVSAVLPGGHWWSPCAASGQQQRPPLDWGSPPGLQMPLTPPAAAPAPVEEWYY